MALQAVDYSRDNSCCVNLFYTAVFDNGKIKNDKHEHSKDRQLLYGKERL